ncbi:hypothetical protein [Streptomyces sp. NPDC017890]|uniref:hypothetical protein n=1 Tax=Streptomyces sp. NPDC017890 TaxID=3365015 RepID=UPI0037A8A72D
MLPASITLGGVAHAAIGGKGGSAADAGPDRSRPPAATGGTEVRPVNTPRPARTASGGPAGPDHPATARDGTGRPGRAAVPERPNGDADDAGEGNGDGGGTGRADQAPGKGK